MKEARIEIIGHDGEVDQKVLDAMARNIRELLNQGFHHDTSITIGNCSFGVFSKDVEVAMSTAPIEGQDAATTDQEASDRLTKSFQDLNKNEPMMTVLDAKTLAYLAYNRGRSIGELHCTLDFENWWIEFRKENGFDKPEPKSLLDRVIDVACDYFGWKGNLDDAMRISDNNLDGFLDTVTRKLNMFGGNMATINHYVDKGYTRKKFLREIAVELYEGKK